MSEERDGAIVIVCGCLALAIVQLWHWLGQWLGLVP